MLFRYLVILSLFFLSYMGTAQASSSEEPQAEKKQPICKDKITISGGGHRIKTIAHTKAIIAWVKRANKHGKDYSAWHKAQKGEVKCEKKPRSSYYVCFASGKPCQNIEPDKMSQKGTP